MARNLGGEPPQGQVCEPEGLCRQRCPFPGKALPHRSYAFTGLQSSHIPTASRGTHKSWPIVNQPNAR